MKKIFKKLACCSFLSIASIGYFNAEARLPKYMAQRAAELLIEKSGLALKDETPQNRKQKIGAFAAQLVDFLYSTNKRQHLANWMKIAFSAAPKNKGEIKYEEIITTDPIYTEACNNLFYALGLQDVIDKTDWVTACHSSTFIKFANQHFPCWTGTLTCFMLNGKVHQLLARGNVVDSCRDELNSVENTRKIVSILFVLELIDNWNDIKQICKIEDDNDDERLKIPDYDEHDPYDCVPVPNTAYEYEGIFKGTCLLSTIRNLLSILGGQYQDFKNFNIKYEVKEYLCSHHLATIPGITNINEQNRWAGTLLAIRDLHFQDLKGFVDTLIGLLNTEDKNILALYKQAELQKYREGFNSRTKTQSSGINQETLGKLITQILKSITNHDIDATIHYTNKKEKATKTWPVLILEISDNSIHKKITVGIGHVGGGQHIEILNIELI